MFIPVLLEASHVTKCLNRCICNIAVLWKILEKKKKKNQIQASQVEVVLKRQITIS